MSNISQIDENFKIETKINKPDIKFLNARNTPFKIYGIFHENGKFRRMPEAVACRVSDGVRFLHSNTAGGRVRFCTDSPYVAIKAVWDEGNGNQEEYIKMPHTCGCGFDMYIDCENHPTSKFYKSFLPPYHCKTGYESVIDLPDGRKRYITINFPTYHNVKDLYIGLAEGATVGEGKKYRIEKPAVFYGSSITQGGCASRPGNIYQAILSRRLDMNYINLGFSGNGKGEDLIVDYMASLEMSAFVSDYDHNASDERLVATHKKMYQKIREKHPDIPYIIVSRADVDSWTGYDRAAWRREVILETYNYARANGDNNVYFIDGESIYGRGNFRECYTVDCIHPTDSGFVKMAEAFEATFIHIINDGKI
jgi:hypothetical protein